MKPIKIAAFMIGAIALLPSASHAENQISSHNLSQNIAWATPRQQENSTRQAQAPHDSMQAFLLAKEAVYECYTNKRLEECEKIDRIQSTLITWCNQNDREACETIVQIQSMVSSAIFLKY